VCDLETSRMGTPYIYDISHLRVNLRPLIFGLSPFGWFTSIEDSPPPYGDITFD
jgi:hypothetical protein